MILESNDANAANLVLFYLGDFEGQRTWTIEDSVCVTAKKVRNRYGLPADAMTLVYDLRNVEDGWSFSVRSVWRNGILFAPTAVHTVIDWYDDDSSAVKINDWFCSLPI